VSGGRIFERECGGPSACLSSFMDGFYGTLVGNLLSKLEWFNLRNWFYFAPFSLLQEVRIGGLMRFFKILSGLFVVVYGKLFFNF